LLWGLKEDDEKGGAKRNFKVASFKSYYYLGTLENLNSNLKILETWYLKMAILRLCWQLWGYIDKFWGYFAEFWGYVNNFKVMLTNF